MMIQRLQRGTSAHWQPLAGLAVEPTTEMYLGLPLSTECGLGRHSAEQLEAVSDAWSELSADREPALAAG